MKISSKVLARVCVALLFLYMVSAIPVGAYLDTESHGITAALFATNAGTAFFVGLVFGLPKLSHYTSRVLRPFVLLIAVVSGLMSALYWMADEVEHFWLSVGIISPVLVILLVLMLFIHKANKEGPKHEGE